ncbi:hypothetical protein [Breoghania sp. L-A4]|nr:hypothetical protein [Breoghania sp. L-A4]
MTISAAALHPAAFLSMIGVDQCHAGHGYGGVLLARALRKRRNVWGSRL